MTRWSEYANTPAEALETLEEARHWLQATRYPLGNDNPAYDVLGAMIEQTFDVERILRHRLSGPIGPSIPTGPPTVHG